VVGKRKWFRRSPPSDQGPIPRPSSGVSPSPPRPLFSRHIVGELSGLLICGVLVAALFGLIQHESGWSIVAVAITTALASAALGGLIGLLFGLPRYIAQGTGSTSSNTAPDSESAPASVAIDVAGADYTTNTNLEEVSDWLTKLLLGAGLTQLGRIPSGLTALGNFLAPAFGGGSAASPFAVVLVVFNLIAGFAFGYLATRLRLLAALREADKLKFQTDVTAEALQLLPKQPVEAGALPPAGDVGPDQKQAAIDLFRTVARLEGATPTTAFDATGYLRLAQQLVRAREFDRALETLELGMQQHPTDPSLPAYAGVVKGVYLGNQDDAERYYLRSLAIKPDYAYSYYNLACNEARRKSPNLDRARAFLTQAFALDPELREYAREDEVWSEFRDRPELSDLLRAKSDTGTGSH
jgi:tetratricopeptide (TPR) repeat protein